jgi:hypothetical protein
LRGLAAAGYLSFDPADETFALDVEMAAVLATDTSPTCTARILGLAMLPASIR